MAELLLGKEVASSMEEDLKKRITALAGNGITPKLVIVRCGENQSDLAYERGILKRAETVGIAVEKVVFPETVSKEELTATIETVNADEKIHGCLIFRPLPSHLRAEQEEICNRLAPEKDVDGITDLSYAGVFTGKKLGFAPCTPEACIAMLDHYGVELIGKNVVLIGRSLVVGKPLAMLLLARHATVTVCHTRTVDLPSIARGADILITAAGALGSLTKEYVKPGQIVIDVSVNWDENKPNARGGRGAIAGDAVFDEVEPVVSAITPVPGGVGTVTTMVLMAHVTEAAERK